MDFFFPFSWTNIIFDSFDIDKDTLKCDSNENNPKFKNLLRRDFVLYNIGWGIGISANLDDDLYDYLSKVYRYAIEFRNINVLGVSNSEKVNRIILIVKLTIYTFINITH